MLNEKEKSLTLGHSPDPDDAIMFHALAHGKVSSEGYVFHHILQDIQTLNERVRRCELDISAISFHAYPYVSKDYALLPCGASMGDGYGPMLVTLKDKTLKDLPSLRIAIPGKLTSAFLALQIYLDQNKIKIPQNAFVVVPFDQIFHALRKGQADVGLLIHEGQLTYAKEGCKLLLDLGVWWKETTQLPLPLGGNVIRKKLGSESMKKVSGILSRSIQYGLDHLQEAMPDLKPYARDLTEDQTRKFIGMYVNHFTIDYGNIGRTAITRFLKEGAERHFIPPTPELEFVH